ncbi:aromatic ring-hydroxylating dioxygenase subunit alpha [Croceicoccus sediminis]|uniref:aromatic ring-hydroxylating dioxygenase subunit alpha n=1 Tax=Croceicoccus sediminis TaxID=2571150 RepID=UPI0011836820|nr:aromatic ring-hydroxylating dioxygenase subunit alpha [Croceicoccus sediminis]
MTYLRNAWYAAAWSEEIGREPLAKTFLDEPVVLYRDTNGDSIALSDRCPHRFAPLSKGTLVGDAIQCPYHGLRFGTDGSCIYNYHGPVPKAASVARYPLMERYGLTWIWMGDPEQADEAKLPDFGPRLTGDDFTAAKGSLMVHANYQLVVDNLLDLTHGEFLHPAFGSPESTKFETRLEGATVYANYRFDDEPVSPAVQPFWTSSSERCDRWANMRWEAPSNLYLEVIVKESGAPVDDDAIIFPASHFLTPETKDSTHYFWTNGRNRLIDDEEMTKLVWQITDNAFRNEDEPMIGLVRDRMAGREFEDLNPIFLTTDRAAGRARQILKKMIESEQSANAAEPNAKSKKSLEGADS